MTSGNSGLHCSVYSEQPLVRWLGALGRDETLPTAFDLWDLSGENIVEHLAEIEDFELAMATYRTACERWRGANITLRAGATVIEDTRRVRTATTKYPLA